MGSNGESVLEAMTRSATGEPDVPKSRVFVDHEVAVRTVLILADASFAERGFSDRRKTACQELPGFAFDLRANSSLQLADIDLISVRIIRHFEATSLETW